MPGIARLGQDIAGGITIKGSLNVFVNGTGVVRLGDNVKSHGLPPHSPIPPMITSSLSVRVNGLGVVKAGDVASCGHIITGSLNVNAGI